MVRGRVRLRLGECWTLVWRDDVVGRLSKAGLLFMVLSCRAFPSAKCLFSRPCAATFGSDFRQVDCGLQHGVHTFNRSVPSIYVDVVLRILASFIFIISPDVVVCCV